MKRKNFAKTILSAALAGAMLTGGALAADPQATPLEPGPEQAAELTDAYGVSRMSALESIMVWGTAVEVGEDRISLENDNDQDPYQKIILNVTEDTLVLDAVSGEARTVADLKKNDTLYAYVSPVMTRSMPPISNAAVILCNIPADFGVPIYAEVKMVLPGEEGKVDVLMSGDIVLHLSADTGLVAAPGAEAPLALADIKPGTRLLSWYTMVMESFPAQAVPSKVMAFPYTYAGYVSAGEEGIEVNGQALELSEAEAPRLQDEHLMVPLRKLAEALGCEVSWQAEDNTVAVKQGENVLYSFTIGGEDAVVDGDMVMALTLPSLAENGVTFVALDDLVQFHGLKLVESWPI